MIRSTMTAAIVGGALVCGLVADARADDPSPQEVAAELKALRAEVEQLRHERDQPWLDQRQVEEVKALVRDVLADAETRTSLAGSAMTGGNDGKGFFLSSEDNTFRLNFSGQIQVRYLANFRQRLAGATTGFDGHETGFQIRRAKLGFDGFIGNPKIEYKILLAGNRDTSAVELEDVWIRGTIAQGLRIWAGRYQDNFAREAMMSSKNQQMVDRSAVANIFAANDGFVEGVGLDWAPFSPADPPVKFAVNINDGLNSGTSGGTGQTVGPTNGGNDFANGASDFAITARVDGRLTPSAPWSDASDVEAWSTVPGFRAFFGGAVHYELGTTGDKQASATMAPTGPYDHFVQWTADTLLKYQGLSLMAAGYGSNFQQAHAAGAKGDLNLYAATVQAGYLFWNDRVEPFARYEYIHPDRRMSATTNDLNIMTFGANYFFKKHASKATLDVLWALNNVNTFNTVGTSLTGIGLLADEPFKKNQIVVRLQYQLLF